MIFGLALAVSGLLWAAPPKELVSHLALRCSSAEELAPLGWSGELWFETIVAGLGLDESLSADAQGLNPSGPIELRRGVKDGEVMLWLSLPVADMTRLRQNLLAVGYTAEGEALRRQTGEWRITATPDDLSSLSVVIQPGLQELPRSPSDVSETLRHASPGEGCALVMSVDDLPRPAPMQLLDMVLLYEVRSSQPDEVRLLLTSGAYSPGPLDTFVGSRGRGPALGFGGAPSVAARVNLDPEPVLKMLAGYRVQAAGTALMGLEQARLDLAPGVELAAFTTDGTPHGVLIVPLERPRRAKKVLRRGLRHLPEDAPFTLRREEELIRVELSRGVVYAGAKARALYISDDPALLRATLAGEGASWFEQAQDWAEAPGLTARVDLSAAGLPVSDLTPRWLSSAELVTQVNATEVGVEVRIRSPGLHQLAASPDYPLRRNVAQLVPPAPEDDPVDDLAPTEVLATLELIAQRQQRRLAEGGGYVPYAGGPRELDALTAEPVPWDGIPALDVPPMSTPCRFEVTLGAEGFTARSLCDQDGDGALAIWMVGPNGRPRRVSPPEVR
ncbi:MAG: hypothetical protein IPN01_01475 [Deltaproteobacteria bacterium]|nr:hypothetical protein [Deltaproteobacteria bacterium]